MSSFRKRLLALSVVSSFAVAGIAASTAFAAPITFAGDADYNNNAGHIGGTGAGVFRDFLDGAGISRGLDLGGAPTAGCPATSCSSPGTHSALNFTGSDTNAVFGGQGSIAVYDTTPLDATAGTASLFSGDLTVYADILISRFNNNKGAGILTLFNEGAGKTGLALFLSNAGSTDNDVIRLVQQDGVGSGSGAGANLASVSLSGGIAEDAWYRLGLDLDITGSTFTITGKVFAHTVTTDPNSSLGAQIGSTLTYSGTLGVGVSDPYEIGLVARAVSTVSDTSVTNFCVNGCPDPTITLEPTATAVPEPASMVLLGIGLLGVAIRRRLAA